MGRKSVYNKEDWMAALERVHKFMLENPTETFCKWLILEELGVSHTTFHKYLLLDEDLMEAHLILKDLTEKRIVIQGMVGKNSTFCIFLLANYYDYSRVDKKVEVVDTSTDKIIFKFDIKNKDDENLN